MRCNSVWRKFTGVAIGLSAMTLNAVATATGVVFQVASRPSATTAVFWEQAPQPKATLLLFPGGGGGFGRVEGGTPSSNNFLVRTEARFVAAGFNVAIFGRPSDSNDLTYEDRTSEAHLADIEAVLRFVESKSAAPIWLVGTSRGTISATAAAIRFQPQLAGLVLTSSIVSLKKSGAVPGQDLASIALPVFVLHHDYDACWVCRPQEVPNILAGLTHSPVKKLVMVRDGGPPTGDACGPLHWHGYVGMEAEAVQLITDWISAPRN